MEQDLKAQIKEAEAAVTQAEKELGPEHPDLADKLQKYANLLRQTDTRKLDIANIEARARSIRAKLYAQDEAAHGTTATMASPGIQRTMPSGPWMYLGIAGVFFAMAALFVSQSFLLPLLLVAVVLAIVDVAMTRTGFWRIGLTLVFAASAWVCNQSLPSNMLIDATPIDRFNYASENPDIVANAKNLGDPINVLGYSISMPKGFTQTDDQANEWGRAITWQGQRENNQAVPQLKLLLMKLPPEKQKKDALFGMARDIAMPQLAEEFQLADLQQDQPRLLEINGIEYAKITFTGKGSDVPRNGFAYVGREKGTLVVLAGDDLIITSDDTLPQMDASIYTFRKQGKTDAEI